MKDWKPISELPIGKKCVALIAKVDMYGREYITDPWFGWREQDGSFARWPHPFSPTHFYELPEFK